MTRKLTTFQHVAHANKVFYNTRCEVGCMRCRRQTKHDIRITYMQLLSIVPRKQYEHHVRTLFCFIFLIHFSSEYPCRVLFHAAFRRLLCRTHCGPQCHSVIVIVRLVVAVKSLFKWQKICARRPSDEKQKTKKQIICQAKMIFILYLLLLLSSDWFRFFVFHYLSLVAPPVQPAPRLHRSGDECTPWNNTPQSQWRKTNPNK